MSDEMDPDLRDLIAGWHGHELPADRCDDLRARLAADPAFREVVAVELSTLTALRFAQTAEPRMYLLAEELSSGEPEPVSPSPDEPHLEFLERLLSEPAHSARTKRFPRVFPVAVAAGVLLAAGILFSWREPTPDPSARAERPATNPSASTLPGSASTFVVAASNVGWEPHTFAPAVGTGFQTGRLVVRSGVVVLATYAGAVLTVEGPADLEIVGDGQAFLRRGRLRARIPPQMLPERPEYSVLFPGGMVGQWQEEFGLVVAGDGRCHVAALTGAVSYKIMPAEGPVRSLHLLKVGSAATFKPPEYDVTEEPLVADRFPTPGGIAPPSPVSPNYANAVRAAGPSDYWRFETGTDEQTPNEVAGRPALRVVGPIEFSGGSAVFRADKFPQYLASERTWAPSREPGFAIELWAMSEMTNLEALVSLLAEPPPDRGAFHHAYVEIRRPRPVGIDFPREVPGMMIPPGTLRFLFRDPPNDGGGESVLSDRVCVPYRWHHVVAQRAGNRLQLYLDGRLCGQAEPPPSSGGLPPECRIVLGRMKDPSARTLRDDFSHVRRFVGKMDEVALYDRPLTLDEIRRHAGEVRP